MMRDLHTHTSFCDGKNTPEEMVQAAVQKGLAAIGFSGHSHTAFDESYCMKKEDIPRYKAEVLRLREAYRDQITVMLGIEQDLYSNEPTGDFDYVIGSVHYIKAGNEYLPVDESEEMLLEGAKKHFGGDLLSLAEAYYKEVSCLAQMHPDIIGHFDLITKFNEGNKLFDPHHPRYVAAWKKAADALLPLGIPFEVNTGAIARGIRTTPYPSKEILAYIKEKGGCVILSGDTHQKENLCYEFSKWEDWLNEIGVCIKERLLDE